MLFQALTFEHLTAFVSAGLTLPTLLWIAGNKPKTIIVVTASFLLFVYVFLFSFCGCRYPCSSFRQF